MSNNAVVLRTVLVNPTKMNSDTILKNIENMNSSVVSASKIRYAKSEAIDRADLRKQLQCC